MFNHFNLKDYFELLDKQDLTEMDELQLLSYGASIERQLSYNRKDEYFSLIRQYLAKKINPRKFRAKFLEMQEADDTTSIRKEDFEQLSNLSINLELKESPFSRLINLIYDKSMIVIEFEPEDDNGISEDEFRASIEKAFSNSKLFK